jgi:hypothetical protein
METNPPFEAALAAFRALCAELGIDYVGYQPGMQLRHWHAPIWLFNVPFCNQTTWTCVAAYPYQRSWLVAAIAACCAKHGVVVPARAADVSAILTAEKTETTEKPIALCQDFNPSAARAGAMARPHGLVQSPNSSSERRTAA